MDSHETRHWYKLPVPLAWLCQLDEQPAENALADAFGDRYLYAHNPIFRRVRDRAIEYGFRFSCEDTSLWRDYQAFPLTTLHRILVSRSIPYLDTANTIRGLLAENPKARLAPGFLLSSLKANHSFHEAAHCVADSVLRRFGVELRALVPEDVNRHVLEGILAESFANSVERFGTLCQHLPVSDGFFYSLNSYVPPDAEIRSMLCKAISVLGGERCFSLVMIAYFEANLTGGPPTTEVYERIAETMGFGADDPETLKAVTNSSFSLSRAFRENTNPSYAELLGCGSAYDALASKPWLDERNQRSFAVEVAKAFSENALDPAVPPRGPCKP